jgi:formylglycine-generating enzyme required for sulfatase activity
MTKRLLLFSILLLLLCSFHKPKTPPNGIYLSKVGVWMDATEVSAIDWLEYMYYLKTRYGAGSVEHLSAYPDSAAWSAAYGLPWKKFFHPAMQLYPVVGVRRDQALAYCDWRSGMVRRQKKWKSITYRLPSREEYGWAIKSGDHQNEGADTLHLPLRANPPSVKARKRIFYYLESNAAEMTNREGELVLGTAKAIGFRCVAVAVPE